MYFDHDSKHAPGWGHANVTSRTFIPDDRWIASSMQSSHPGSTMYEGEDVEHFKRYNTTRNWELSPKTFDTVDTKHESVALLDQTKNATETEIETERNLIGELYMSQ